ncbi:MAG: glutamine--fructose-6-phosphate transaminase (isomerizing) [Clostridia bacterium]|nr:glutamine--fructose-6-phosphate transaminase (isomerizing) [Clostridia bacterium]
MCGIVGYIGKSEKAIPFLLQGLEKLEYRGYDSSGIAILNQNEIKIIKKQGRLKVIKDILDGKKELHSHLVIGHKRWATHGNHSDVNAHPHLSKSGKISVVHNGIIENYINLKKDLTKKGYEFKSDTDTEVVAQLLDSLYNGDMFETIKKATQLLEGSFALGIICADYPDTLFAAKKDSPLIIGLGENENYIASDIPAVLSKTRKICRLKEKQIAVLKNSDINIFDFNGNKAKMEISEINWNVNAAEKNNYDHFMIKEIMEQPEVLNATISPRLKDYKIKLDNLNFNEEYLKNLNKISIVACGSAYHVGCVAKYFMEELIKKPVEVELASEFRYRSPIVDKNTLVIIISQSGETADSLAALREAKKLGARVLSVVNVVGSSIANESDDVLYTWAGPEIAVATTKAYSTQLSLMYLIALYISKTLGKITDDNYKDIIKNIESIPEKITAILKKSSSIEEIAKKYYQTEKIFFIGRTLDYAVCMEASLKLKEISYIHSEAYAAGELKHGTISLIDDKTLVIALATQDELFDKTISNIREVKSRGATILLVTTEDKMDKISEIADDVIYVPKISNILSPSLSVVPMQLLSYYVAKFRGCDIDKPRNLAKSVTVE